MQGASPGGNFQQDMDISGLSEAIRKMAVPLDMAEHASTCSN